MELTPTQIKLMEKMASYIEATQPLIDANNEQRTNFTKRATQAAGVLAHRGVIDPRQVNTFVDKVAEDPAAVWDFVEKLASVVGADVLGEAVREKQASGGSVDPFEREFFGAGRQRSGMVD